MPERLPESVMRDLMEKIKQDMMRAARQTLQLAEAPEDQLILATTAAAALIGWGAGAWSASRGADQRRAANAVLQMIKEHFEEEPREGAPVNADGAAH